MDKYIVRRTTYGRDGISDVSYAIMRNDGLIAWTHDSIQATVLSEDDAIMFAEDRNVKHLMAFDTKHIYTAIPA